MNPNPSQVSAQLTRIPNTYPTPACYSQGLCLAGPRLGQVPVGLLERLPARLQDRPPRFVGRNDLETLMASPNAHDWVKTTEP